MKTTDKGDGARSPGELLRAARVARGITPGEAADATRIKVQVIEAIERNEFDRIPAPTYAKGFIRLYADFVGLDPEPLIQAYNDHHVPADQRRGGSHKAAKSTGQGEPGKNNRAVPRWIDVLPLPRVAARVAIVVGILVAVVLILMGMVRLLIRGDDQAAGEVAPSRQAETAWTLVAEPPDPYLSLPGEGTPAP